MGPSTRRTLWIAMALTAAASVSVLDVQRFAVVASVAVCRQPIVMAAHPSGRTLYVSCEGSHELAVVAIPP